MQIGRIRGTTRVLGQSQGYIGLPIRDIKFDDGTPAMESAWLLSTDEIQPLINGRPLILRLLGDTHPPVHVRVDKEGMEHTRESGAERHLPTPHPLGARCIITDRFTYAGDWKGWQGFIYGVHLTPTGELDYTVCTMLPDRELTDGFKHNELQVVW